MHHQIYLSNRTKEKAEILKNLFEGTEVLEWGKLPDFDMIINATSLGLKQNDRFGIDFSKLGKNKYFLMLYIILSIPNFLKLETNQEIY